MRQGSTNYSDMGHILFLNSTCGIVENKRHGHSTLPFLKFDMQHWEPPIKGPITPGDPAPQTVFSARTLTFQTGY